VIKEILFSIKTTNKIMLPYS